MKKRDFYITIIVYGILSAGFIASKYIFKYELDWILMFLIIFSGYLYVRYRITSPVQRFAKTFNMLVDYDLDMDAAIELCLDHIKEAPTLRMKALYQVHLGMAYYNNGEYEQALQVFREIEMSKLYAVYHVLIFAHEAYIYNELGQKDDFEAALERIRNVRAQIHRKYMGYANSYERLLTVIGHLEENPEEYKQVVEANLSQHNGYISQRLIYHYRLAKYYEAIGDEKEMDIQLAKVLANGKGHFTAKEAQKMFKNSVNVDDYIFTDEDYMPEPPVEEPSLDNQIEDSEVIDVFDDSEEDK
jgi:tetratricopeptide (TPR) repeat protein